MKFTWLKKIFGLSYDKTLKRYDTYVQKINALEKTMHSLSDKALKEKTIEFKSRLSQGESLDNLLIETFATVREASIRSIGMRHFDVQLIGGMVLHENKIAEMKTGEGKTLAATLAAYLNALSGKGVHIVTVNDYLAKRDAEWMGPIFEFLGLRVGFIEHSFPAYKRKESYACDITYGTNNEFGFDYLRDNMVDTHSKKVLKDFHYAIVDEVDSILIDEARTPLIISGPSEESTGLYHQINQVVPKMKPAIQDEDKKWIEDSGDYEHDEKDRNIILTEQGIEKSEHLLGTDNLYNPKNIHLLHHLNRALTAHVVFKKDIDYIVENGQVIIIDEHTGRKMPGRRYSDGLHQALEAKEGVKIEQESQTLASITFQNYFKMYTKLSGMTGTAETEAEEFYKIYKLPVIVIPTNAAMIRKDHADRVYRTEKEKEYAIIQEIKSRNRLGQPIVVGTISIEKNEILAKALKREGIPFNMLNAKYHEMEAKIISQAGQKGGVTIATNMAGRGTDIKLGEGVKELGGLFILGTERHESRRIDNQLRGRSGRQGDQGESRFYLSLHDNLLRLFGSNRIGSLMQRMGFEENQEIEHPWISKGIANAQRKLESRNFEIRKHLLEYDDVMNVQRHYVYGIRDTILKSTNIKSTAFELMHELCKNAIFGLTENKIRKLSNEELDEIEVWFKSFHRIVLNDEIQKNKEILQSDKLIAFLIKIIKEEYNRKEAKIGSNTMNEIARFVLLQSIDVRWKQHLQNMDVLKEGIHLQSYAEKNPLVEYKLEASRLFEELKMTMTESSLSMLNKIEVSADTADELFADHSPLMIPQKTEHHQVGHFSMPSQMSNKLKNQSATSSLNMSKKVKVGRNDDCICGSKKKYKKCCGRI